MTEWISDNHRISLAVVNDDIKVASISCPYENTRSGQCWAGRDFCVVRRFIEVYGFDFCLGSAAVSGPIEIAWVAVLGDSDLDSEVGAIYFTPVDDEKFQKALRG